MTPSRPSLLPALLMLYGCEPAAPPATGPDSPCASDATLEGGVCVPVSCGAVPWAGEAVDAWVDASAAQGGDGSIDAPFRGIQEALDAGATGVLAVQPGAYEGALTLSDAQDGLRLLGRCSALVTLLASDDEPAISIASDSGGAEMELRGLTVQGGFTGIALDSGALSLSDVAVRDAIGVGVSVATPSGGSTARLSVADLVIDEVSAATGIAANSPWAGGFGLLALPDAVVEGEGLSVEGTASYGFWGFGADIDLERLDVRDAVGLGLAASQRASLHLGQLTVSGVADDTYGSGFGGMGLFVESRSQVDVKDDTHIEGVSWYGVMLYGSDGQVAADLGGLTLDDAVGYGAYVYNGAMTLRDCDLRGMAPWESSLGPIGPWGAVAWTASLSLERCTLGTDGGQVLATERSTVTITDSDIDGSSNVDPGNACLSVSDSTAEVVDTTIHDCQGSAILAGRGTLERSSVVSLSGVDLASNGAVLDQDASKIAVPLQLKHSRLVAEHTTITDSVEAALLLDLDSVAELTDVDIEGVSRGDGLAMAIGVVVQGGSQLSGEDLVVRDVEGIGAYVTGGRLDCAGCEVSDTSFAGIWGAGRAALHLTSTSVSHIVHDANAGGGVGIGVEQSSSYPPFHPLPSLYLSDARVEDVELAALFLDGPGSYKVIDSVLEAGNASFVPHYPSSNAIFVTGGAGRWSGRWGGTGGLLLQGDELIGGDGGAIFLDQSSATLSDLSFDGASPELVLNRCGEAPEPEGIDEIAEVVSCDDHAYDYDVIFTHWYLYTLPIAYEG